jgi:pyruvate-ferredoxin/flavodoxin oxidoreductase
METIKNPLCEKYLENNDYETSLEVYNNIDKIPELKKYKDYIKKRSIWAVGGDGWAYDIGFGGIDHALSTRENINILVLDTQVYSNTGGQASKATPIGALAQFAGFGKKNYKKDLARIALSYPHVYVGTVCLGANPNQLIKVLKEANNYNGPSIVIAYAPCISHGITGGMENSIEIEKQAVSCGYYPLFHYMPDVGFTLDSKNVDFNDYSNFIERQTRFNALKKVNPSEANELLEYNINEAKKRFYYYESLDKK